MGAGASIVLIAAGAILSFAVHVHVGHGVDLNAIGVILMLVGAVGLLVSMLVWGAPWGGVHRTVEVDEAGRPVRQRVVRETRM